MRDICKVIERLKEVIPEQRVNVRVRLEQHARRAVYVAPESQQQEWIDLMMTLQEHLGEQDCEWKRTVGRIMRGEE